MNQTERQSLTEEFRQEQHAAHQKIDEWRQWWEELSEFGQPRFGEMHDRLQLIRAHLKAHFRHEEQSGFFQQIAEREPDYAPQCDRLVAEHQTLLNELDRLCTRLGTAEPEFENWGAANRAFEDLLRKLENHEKQEHSLFEVWKTSKNG